MDFNWIQQSVDLNNLLNWITTFNLLLNNPLNWIMMIYFLLNNLLNWILVKPIWIESILGKIQTLNWINLGIQIRVPPGKKSCFWGSFLQKTASHDQTVQFWLDIVIHRWKALDLSFFMVFLKKYFVTPAKCQNFVGRIWTDIFTYIETLSYALYNI